jgi:hypothetical protein
MSKNNTGAKVVMGAAGAALAAAAAAGAYLFYGSDHAAKNRKQMKSWMVKAKGDIMEQLENLNEVTQAGYETAVAGVLSKYKQAKNIDPKELAALTTEVKQAWKKISNHLQSTGKTKPKNKKLPAKKK